MKKQEVSMVKSAVLVAMSLAVADAGFDQMLLYPSPVGLRGAGSLGGL